MPTPNYLAFEGDRLLAQGPLAHVILAVKHALDARPDARHWVFEDQTSALVDFNYAGTPEQVLARLPAPAEPTPVVSVEACCALAAKSGKPGRPRLGVVAREVTLLPRHWDWLNQQPGGASVALRKLVEQARRANQAQDVRRLAQAACYRFMSAMAGDRIGFEEAARALFAADAESFSRLTAPWPADVRQHLLHLARPAFDVVTDPTQQESSLA